MAAAKFRSVAHGKIVIFVATVATIVALLFSTGYAQEAPLPPSASPPSPPAYVYPPCETLGVPLPECQSWCAKIGFHGGYLKADVCCCNN